MSSKKSIHLIKDIEFITCPYCYNNFKLLHWKHLKTHNKTLEDVRNEFPGNPTMTQKEYNRRLEISKIGAISSKKTLLEIKNIKCFYCNTEKEVPKNYPNKFVCDNCLSKGKEDIDNRKKEETKIKRINTNIEKYGEDYVNIQHENSMKTQNEKFNGKIGFANDEIKEKIEKINEVKYGTKNYMQSEKAMEKQFKKVVKLLEYLNLELISDYNDARGIIKIKCLKCSNIFETQYTYIYQGYGKCPNCFPRYESNKEIELFNFIKSLNLDIFKNSRDIIPPYELDIFISEKNIAIEFDGLYWHSEDKIEDKNYHLNKTELCESKNIQLIHIFEDEWLFKKEIVKSRLKQILGIGDSIRIHARKCEIKEICPKIKNLFLNEFHIQGEDKSSVKLGAFYEDELISVMTFSYGNISKGSKNIEGIYELSRFCSDYNYHIPGIASKLLEYFKRNYEWKEIYSYADRRWSDGNLYYKIGFELYNITKPNYWYVKGFNRIHRFNLRKRSDEPKEIPEYILRSKEGYFRIWDCGHYKFIIKNE